MFKVLKYLLLANLYNRAKKSFFILFGSLISLLLTSLILNDAVSVASGISIYILLLVKWIIILSLLGLIGFSILKIINVATSPFTTEEKSQDANETIIVDVKKARVLNKEKLLSKSDLIMQKYMKDSWCIKEKVTAIYC